MKYAKAAAGFGSSFRRLFALLIAMIATPAVGAENPLIAGMRAMLNSMGFQEESSRFSDPNPFNSMTDVSPFDMPSWSSMGSMPGMGISPWTGMMPGFGINPWNSMMPGTSSFTGMPGFMSPWDYAQPDRWSKYMPGNTRKIRRGTHPNSPTRAIDGMWIGPNGERLWFKDGWLRVYRDVHSDARALTRGHQLFIGIPETKDVMRFEYGTRGSYLGLRDDSGNVQVFRRVR